MLWLGLPCTPDDVVAFVFGQSTPLHLLPAPRTLWPTALAAHARNPSMRVPPPLVSAPTLRPAVRNPRVRAAADQNDDRQLSYKEFVSFISRSANAKSPLVRHDPSDSERSPSRAPSESDVKAMSAAVKAVKQRLEDERIRQVRALIR